MLTLHPKIISEDDDQKFVVLPYNEWLIVQEMLEDAQDLADLRAAKAEDTDEPNIPFAEVKRQLNIP